MSEKKQYKEYEHNTYLSSPAYARLLPVGSGHQTNKQTHTIYLHYSQAAAAGANTSVTLVPGKKMGPIPLANIATSNNPTSVPDNWDCCNFRLSRRDMSFSSVSSAAVMSVWSFLELITLLLFLLLVLPPLVLLLLFAAAFLDKGRAATSGVMRCCPLLSISPPPLLLLPKLTILPLDEVPYEAMSLRTPLRFCRCHLINRLLREDGPLPENMLAIPKVPLLNQSAG